MLNSQNGDGPSIDHFSFKMTDFRKGNMPRKHVVSSKMLDSQRRNGPPNRLFSAKIIDFLILKRTRSRVTVPCMAPPTSPASWWTISGFPD
jgi:hypothetical protein